MNYKILILCLVAIVALVFIGYSFYQFDTSIPVEYYRLGGTVYDFTNPINKIIGLFNSFGDTGSKVLDGLGVLEHYDIEMKIVTFTNNDESEYAYIVIWGIKGYREGIDPGDYAFRIYAYKDYNNSSRMKNLINSNICYYPYTYEYEAIDDTPGTTLIGRDNWTANIIRYPFSLINRPRDLNDNTTFVYKLVSIQPFDMKEFATYNFELPLINY